MKKILCGTTIVFILSVWLQHHRFTKLKSSYSTVIYDRDHRMVDAFLSADDKWRFEVDLARVGDRFIKANLCLEDQRFWTHPGVDPLSILRASIQNVKSGRIVSGGSTVTMQLARLLHPGPRTLLSKINEAIDALYLEMFLSKKEILKRYLELAPYGRYVEGVEAASQILLQKQISDADFSEMATLLLIPQLPSRIFKLDTDGWKKLRDRNLERFLECKLVTNEELQVEKLKPVTPLAFHWFAKPRHISLELKKLGTTTVRSTLAFGLQKEIERYFAKSKSQINAKNIANVAALVVENESGEVLSAIGNFQGDFPTADLNALVEARSPGSTLKPLIYALAIQEGLLLPQSMVQDVPIEIGGYSPENYDRKFRGLISAEESLSYSLNVPFVIMLRKLGMEYFLGHLTSLGVEIELPKATLGLSSAIGALPLKPLDLAKMYLSFANGGRKKSLKFIEDNRSQEADFWIDPGANELMGRALAKQKRRENIPARFLLYGKEPIHWKTGTSQGRKDAWAIGYDSRYTVLVWMGNLDMTPSANLVGASASGPALFEIFDLLGKKSSSGTLKKYYDSHLTETEVCAFSGLKPAKACKTKWVTGISSRSLNHECPYHQRVEVENKSGLVVYPGCRKGLDTSTVNILNLPEKVRIWSGRNLTDRRVHPQCRDYLKPKKFKLSILNPKHGMTYYLFDQPDTNRMRLPLKLSGLSTQSDVHCFLNGTELSDLQLAEGQLDLPIGVHELACSNENAQLTKSNFKITHF